MGLPPAPEIGRRSSQSRNVTACRCLCGRSGPDELARRDERRFAQRARSSLTNPVPFGSRSALDWTHFRFENKFTIENEIKNQFKNL
jgi:hypothetical protein